MAAARPGQSFETLVSDALEQLNNKVDHVRGEVADLRVSVEGRLSRLNTQMEERTAKQPEDARENKRLNLMIFGLVLTLLMSGISIVMTLAERAAR